MVFSKLGSCGAAIVEGSIAVCPLLSAAWPWASGGPSSPCLPGRRADSHDQLQGPRWLVNLMAKRGRNGGIEQLCFGCPTAGYSLDIQRKSWRVLERRRIVNEKLEGLGPGAAELVTLRWVFPQSPSLVLHYRIQVLCKSSSFFLPRRWASDENGEKLSGEPIFHIVADKPPVRG